MCKRGKHNPTLGMTDTERRDYYVGLSKYKYGNKYDYSDIISINLKKSDVIIICPIHGKLSTSFHKHLDSSTGCTECGKLKGNNNKRLTFEEISSKLKVLHPDLKVLTKTLKDTSIKNQRILVKDSYGLLSVNGHGLLKTAPPNIKTAIFPSQYFLNKYRERFGWNDNLDFSKFEYKGASKYCNVICKFHGEFQTKPNWLLNGQRCSECFNEKRKGGLISSNLDEFISKMKGKNLPLYDYSNSNYISAKSKMEIVCKYHGTFQQTPNDQLSGYGCPTCGNILSAYNCKTVRGSKKIMSGIYLMKFDKEGLFKIGISKNGNNRRCGEIKSDCNGYYSPSILYYTKMTLFNAATLENILHKKYKHLSQVPKIPFAGQTECFSKDLPVNEVIKQIETFNIL